MREYTKYDVSTLDGATIVFIGKHLPERETQNWHYYETSAGDIIHLRKEHMVRVIEYLTWEGETL